MTVETVLNNVLLEIGNDRTSAQITATDYEMRQIKAFMDAAGRDLAARAEWSGLFTAATATGASENLPADFWKMPESGDVRTSGGAEVRAVTSPELWAFLAENPSTEYFYHLRGGQILFSPELPAGNATYTYISNSWCTGGTSITQNSNTVVFPERLLELGTIWRWKRQKSLPYDDYISELEADLQTAIAADRGAA